MTHHDPRPYRTNMGFVGRLCDECAHLGLGYGGTGLFPGTAEHDRAVADAEAGE